MSGASLISNLPLLCLHLFSFLFTILSHLPLLCLHPFLFTIFSLSRHSSVSSQPNKRESTSFEKHKRTQHPTSSNFHITTHDVYTSTMAPLRLSLLPQLYDTPTAAEGSPSILLGISMRGNYTGTTYCDISCVRLQTLKLPSHTRDCPCYYISMSRDSHDTQRTVLSPMLYRWI